MPSTSNTSATHRLRCSFLRCGSRSMQIAKNQHRAVSSRSSTTYRGPAQLKNTSEKRSMAIFFCRAPRSAAWLTRFSAKKRNTNSRLENTISSSQKSKKNAKKVPIPGAKNSVGNRNPLYLV